MQEKIKLGIDTRLEIEKAKLAQQKFEMDESIKNQVEQELSIKSQKENEELKQLYVKVGKQEKEKTEYKILQDKRNKEFDDYKKKMEDKSSHTIGTIGEKTLLEHLNKYFPNDVFARQKVGQPVADITQTIHESEIILKTKICYDNKENTGVSTTDCNKAKSYMETHDTEYVLIVSSKLPSDFGDSMLGTKEGVILVHPLIVASLAKIIRKAIINYENVIRTHTNKEQNNIKLYEYIISTTFDLQLRKLFQTQGALLRIQTDEEKAMKSIWSKRHIQLENIHISLMEIAEELTTKTDKQFTGLLENQN